MTKSRVLLYLYGYSPRKKEELEEFYKILEYQLKNNVKINLVFIQDGVIAINQKNLKNESLDKILMINNSQISFYGIKQDLIARGLGNISHDFIKVIDYEDLVEIMENSDNIISWI
ncbi:MAG: sulfurtransferase complex subunit TusB [Candidatus Lokiarchaeota archaeon]